MVKWMRHSLRMLCICASGTTPSNNVDTSLVLMDSDEWLSIFSEVCIALGNWMEHEFRVTGEKREYLQCSYLMKNVLLLGQSKLLKHRSDINFSQIAPHASEGFQMLI